MYSRKAQALSLSGASSESVSVLESEIGLKDELDGIIAERKTTEDYAGTIEYPSVDRINACE